MSPRRTRRRLALLLVATMAVVGLFVVRLVDIQVVRADALTTEANASHQYTATLFGTRGSIVAEDGTVLADSVERFDITAAPRNVDWTQTMVTENGDRHAVPTTQAVADIAAITGDDADTLLAALQKDPTSNFAYLSKAQPLAVFQQVSDLGIAWVYSQPHPSRSYPDGAVAGNLVGFVGTDGPLAGLELSADSCLAATDGTTSYVSAPDGTKLPGTTQTVTPATDGGTLRLTIDTDLQWFAQQALQKQGQKIGAKWATAFVVRVSDGHVMAAADWPSIDPNDLNSVPAADAGARSFTAPYEPGSIMKPATLSSLIDAGVVSPTDKVTVPSEYTKGLPPGHAIFDSEVHGTEHWTTAGILAHSSNIGVSILSTRLPVADRDKYLEAFGFNSETAVGFLGEDSGHVTDPDQVDVITSLNQQYGQGMTATSAQIASMYQTIGNGGVRQPLTLVEGCEHADGTVTDKPSTQGTRVVSQQAAQETIQMMESVIPSGTLQGVISFPGYTIAAKTGTAEIAEHGVYTNKRVISVAGLVPADAPQYAVVVTFYDPVTIKLASGAAPAFANIVNQVIKTYRIPPATSKPQYYPLAW